MNNNFGCKVCMNTNYPMMHDCSSENKILDIKNAYSNMIKIAEDMKNMMSKMIYKYEKDDNKNVSA